MSDFYDGTKLLSLSDLNGNKPEIFISTSNRSAGKTTFFNRMLINSFKKRGEYFLLLYRFKYELANCDKKFFNEINILFFPKDKMTAKTCAKGLYVELYLNGILCGFATSLNCADNLKKYSHIFSNVNTILMDEFQSEQNNYCQNEIDKFISIHTSVARGGGKQSRYVKTILVGNPVDILNPYYTALNIGYRLEQNTKFLRGDGYVLEQGFNKSASNSQNSSIFNRAFSDNDYMQYNLNGIYLNNDYSLIEKKTGNNTYLCTLIYKNKRYCVRLYDDNTMYCGDNVDHSFSTVYSVGQIVANVPLISQANIYLISLIQKCFKNGMFKFKKLECKEAIFNIFNYHA